MGGDGDRGCQPRRRKVRLRPRATREKDAAGIPGCWRAGVLRGETADTSHTREIRVGRMGSSRAGVLCSLRDRGPPQRRRTARVAGQRVALGNTNRAGRRSALAKTVEEGLEDLGTKVVESAKMAGECRGGSQNTWPVQS